MLIPDISGEITAVFRNIIYFCKHCVLVFKDSKNFVRKDRIKKKYENPEKILSILK